MIDKLKLTSKEPLCSERLHRSLSSLASETRGNLDRLYLCSRSYLINGKLITLKTISKQSNISPICIELNPSHFESFTELKGVIGQMIDIDLLKISRLDHKVDLPVPYSEIKNKIDVKFKFLRSDYYGSRPTGMTIGRGNETICIYDKTEQSKLSSTLTRIEVREKFKYLKIESLLDIELLLNYNPFAKIRIMDLSEPSNHGSPKSYNTLKNSIEAKGLLFARKELSQNNNFSKTYERYLEKSYLDDMMLSNYQNDLNKFLRS